jgi:hypothetical protein
MELDDPGAGVIAIALFSQRTSSGIPGFIPDHDECLLELPIGRRDQWSFSWP